MTTPEIRIGLLEDNPEPPGPEEILERFRDDFDQHLMQTTEPAAAREEEAALEPEPEIETPAAEFEPDLEPTEPGYFDYDSEADADVKPEAEDDSEGPLFALEPGDHEPEAEFVAGAPSDPLRAEELFDDSTETDAAAEAEVGTWDEPSGDEEAAYTEPPEDEDAFAFTVKDTLRDQAAVSDEEAEGSSLSGLGFYDEGTRDPDDLSLSSSDTQPSDKPDESLDVFEDMLGSPQTGEAPATQEPLLASVAPPPAAAEAGMGTTHPDQPAPASTKHTRPTAEVPAAKKDDKKKKKKGFFSFFKK